MQHIFRRALLLALLILSSPLLSTHDDGNPWQSNIGLNFNYARFQFGCLPKFDGYLAGVHWDISHSLPCHFYANLQFDGNWNAGPMCSFCDECDCDPNTCNTTNTTCNNDCTIPTTPPLGCPDLKARIKDLRPELDFGYSFTFCEHEQVALTPIIGVGFMYLSNRLKPQEVTYRYFNVNVPIGFKFLWIGEEYCDRQFDVGLDFTYRIDAWTRLKLRAPNIDMGTITCNQENDCDRCERDCNNNCPNPSTITVTCVPNSCNNDCDNDCDNGCKIHLSRTHGIHLSVPMTWSYNYEDACVNWQTKIVPFFDWNKFGCAQEVNENNLPVEIPRLKQWYLGLHVDVGINF